jgi:hypothetical protein
MRCVIVEDGGAGVNRLDCADLAVVAMIAKTLDIEPRAGTMVPGRAASAHVRRFAFHRIRRHAILAAADDNEGSA